MEFLGAFAGVVGSKWPSLVTTLSLSESEIKEVKREGLSQQDHALQMVKKWASREDATYGQLCQRLKTTSFKYSGDSYAHMHTPTCTHTHTHAHTRMHKHTHSHVRMYTQLAM